MKETIRLLSDHTIDKIAAGEVIESPASVVKELIENSLDADAAAITIEIKGGGLGQITISDNGRGMSRVDAEMCLKRHATSKIERVEDLFSIQTMGFRGEALASIAAISKLTLTTSRGEREGTRVDAAASKVVRIEPAPRAQGTTVDVRSLFYNVPARKKFQKSTPRLCAEVTRVVTELALAHPCVSFELVSEGKRILFAAPEQEVGNFLLRRSQTILGDVLGSKGFVVDFEEAGVHLKGILGAPSETRPNRAGQHLFVNARSVVCPALSFAVKEGYGTRIEPARFPVFVLHLTLPPSRLDVNVHPQKKEVRFQEEIQLKALIARAVSNSFTQMQRDKGPKRIFIAESPSHTSPFRPSSEGLTFQESGEQINRQESFPFSLSTLQPIGIYRSYLLLDGATVERVEGEGLVLVDLLAARARLLFDVLQKGDRKMESQSLLFPITFSVTPLEMAHITPDLPLLEQCGFDMRPIGETALLIEAYPVHVDETKLKEIILELTTIKERERKVASLASRLARSGKKTFTQIEGVRLFEDLLKSTDPNHCPLGKKTLISLEKKDIEKLY